jgi:hypothetical protein
MQGPNELFLTASISMDMKKLGWGVPFLEPEEPRLLVSNSAL